MEMRGEWRFASKESGEQCAKTLGITMMQRLFADNWDLDL